MAGVQELTPVLGAGAAARMLLAGIHEQGWTVLGLLDDDPAKRRTRIGSAAVLGPLEAVRDNDKVAIRSGHGVGKTTYLAWLVLWWLMTRHPAKIAATPNTAHASEATSCSFHSSAWSCS